MRVEVAQADESDEGSDMPAHQPKHVTVADTNSILPTYLTELNIHNAVFYHS
jgi:hypothetical protein